MFYFNQWAQFQSRTYPERFNPYFTGCSTSTILAQKKPILQKVCFNPYFTGCSTSTISQYPILRCLLAVSILILLDVLLQQPETAIP